MTQHTINIAYISFAIYCRGKVEVEPIMEPVDFAVRPTCRERERHYLTMKIA